MGFLDRIRRPQTITAAEADGMILDHLAQLGADLSRPRHVSHFLYFTVEELARRAAAEIERAAYDVTVLPPERRIRKWVVRAEAERVVDADTAASARAWFELVAADCDGEYDGWEAAAEP